jgi:hypothetical protein
MKTNILPDKKSSMLRGLLLCIVCGLLVRLTGCVAYAQNAPIAVDWPRAWQESLSPSNSGQYSWSFQQTNIADTNRWFFVMDNNITTNGMDFYSATLPLGIPDKSWLTYQFSTTKNGTNIAKWEGRMLYDRNAIYAGAPLGTLTGQPSFRVVTTNR